MAALNLVEAGSKVSLAHIGLRDSDTVAVEYDEFGDARLSASIARAEAAVDRLVERLCCDLGRRSGLTASTGASS